MVADRQGKAVAAITELELALEVGAPEIIGGQPLGQRRAARAMARPAAPLDQAMAVEHRMDRALCRNPDIPVELSDQQLPNLAGAPMRLVVLQPDDQGLDLLRELVGVTDRPPGAVA